MAFDPETKELLEPLRAFLETFTDELAQQKFIPAFQKEIAQVRGAFEDLSRSQETLEQIARGVDRLREVFAPAGTRLLEHVKELEQLLAKNVEQLHGYAREVLTNLQKTHEELEGSLRSDAEHIRESAEADREVLARAVADVEKRLARLTSPLPSAHPGGGPVEEGSQAGLRELFEAMRGELEEKWGQIHLTLEEGLAASQQPGKADLQRIADSVQEIASGIGPKVQREVETALAVLQGDVQAVAHKAAGARKKEKSGGEGRGQFPVAREDLRAELAAGIDPLGKKLAALREAYRGDLTEFQRPLTEILQKLTKEASVREKRSQQALAVVTESLGRLEKLTHEAREAAAMPKATLESFAETARQQKEEFKRHASGESEFFERVEAQIAHAQEAALAAAEKMQKENAACYRQIEEGLGALPETFTVSLEADRSEIEAFLNRLSGEWQERWTGGLGEVTAALGELEESITQRLADIATTQASESQAQRETTQILTAEFDRVSSEVALVRSVHAAYPDNLKDAIKGGYAEAQERLGQVIDAGYDKFLQQISTVPQSLERYANLLESLHQSDELALNAIAADCRNILKLASKEFEELGRRHEVLKKIFPVLERRLERQLGEIGAVRRVADSLEKALQAVGKELRGAETSLSELLHSQSAQTADLAGRTAQGLAEVSKALEKVRADIEHLRRDALATLQHEITDLVTSKFEFMERALVDHHSALKSDLAAGLGQERHERGRGANWLFILVGFGIFLQLLIYYFTQGPLAPPLP